MRPLSRPVALVVNSMVCQHVHRRSGDVCWGWTQVSMPAKPGVLHGDSNMTTQAIRGLEEANRISALSRRGFFLAAAAVGGFALTPDAARAAIVRTDIANLPPYGNGTLPAGIRSRTVANVNGMTVHM